MSVSERSVCGGAYLLFSASDVCRVSQPDNLTMASDETPERSFLLRLKQIQLYYYILSFEFINNNKFCSHTIKLL